MIGAEAERVSETGDALVLQLRERQQRERAEPAESRVGIRQARGGGLFGGADGLRQHGAARELLGIDLVRRNQTGGMHADAGAAAPVDFEEEIVGYLALEAKVEILDVAG